jgi:hypothetical protein
VPHAGSLDTDLARNDTSNLIADIERLGQHLEVERWVLLVGCWAAAPWCWPILGISRARHGDQLVGCHDQTATEFDWLSRGGVAPSPERWERLCAALVYVESITTAWSPTYGLGKGTRARSARRHRDTLRFCGFSGFVTADLPTR